MTKDEALKMAYKAEETGNLQDLVDAVNACKEALQSEASLEFAFDGRDLKEERKEIYKN